MSDRMKRSLELNINTNVNTKPIKDAERDINGFFDKYDNKSLDFGIDSKSLKIDTRDFHKAIVATQRLEEEIDGVRKSAPMMIKALSADIEFAENIRNEFKEVSAVFNDNSVITGLDNVISKIKDGFSVVAVDLGNRVRYLNDEIFEVMENLKNIGAVKKQWGTMSFTQDDLDERGLSERIELVKKLISHQRELELFSGSKFDGNNSPIGDKSDNLEWNVKMMENTLRSLEEYNSQVEEQYKITTKQLARRKELISEVDYVGWGEDNQRDALKNVGNEDEYNDALSNLRYYIETRKNLIDELKANENELFRAEGISQYIEKIETQIKAYESNIKELETAKKGQQGAPVAGIDFSEVVEQLKEIKEAVKAITTAFEPLTNALSAEDNALHKMLTTSIEDLNTLESRLKEVYQMIDTISKKDFNITQQTVYNTKASTSMQSNASFGAYKEKAQALLDVISQLVNVSNQLSYSNSGLFANVINQLNAEGRMGEFFDTLNNFDPANFTGKIEGAETNKDIKNIVGKLTVYKNMLLDVVNIINSVKPGTVDTSFLSVLDDADEKINKINSGIIDANNLQKEKQAKSNDLDKKNTDIDLKSEETIAKFKTLSEQIEAELTSIRSRIEKTFDFSTVDPKIESVKTITDAIYQQFVELQTKINALDLNLGTSAITVKTDETNKESFTGANKNVGDVSIETSKSVDAAAEAIKQEGNEAEIAAQKKREFVEANKAVANSGETTKVGVKEATEAIKEEGDVAKQVASEIEDATTKAKVSIDKLQADQDSIISEYKKYGGSGKVSDNLAERFNNVLANAGVDASSITSTFGLKTARDEDGNQYYYDYIKLIAKGTDELGKATTVTREYVVATGELINKTSQFRESKDSFDLAAAIETANSKLGELKTRMGSFKIDIQAVETALRGINDETTFNAFTDRVKDAEQKLSEIKATLKSSKSLDPITNAENQMRTIGTVVETYRKNIEKFANVEGFSALETHLSNITTKITEYNKADNGIDKAKKVQEINQEIDQYNAKLKLVQATHQENTRLAKQEAKDQKKQIDTYNAILQLQEKLYNLKKKMVELDPQSAKGQETMRKITEAQKEYNDVLAHTHNLTSQQRMDIKSIEAQQESELSALRNEHKSKISAEQEAKDLEYVLSLYKKYTDAAQTLKKIQSDTTGAAHTEKEAAAIEDIQNAQADLLSLGIDVNNISESELLTEQQKNALLEEQVKYKKQIRDIENASSDKAATKENKQHQAYGKTIYNREARYFDTIGVKTSSLASDATLNDDFLAKLEKYKTAFKELENLRDKFASNPDAFNNEALKGKFQETALEVEGLRKEILSTFKDAQKFEAISNEALLGSVNLDADKLKNSKAAMIDYAATVTNGKFQLEGFNIAGTEMYGVLNKGNGVVEKVTVALRAGTNQLYAFRSGTKETASSWSKLGSELKNGVKQLVGMYFGFHEAIQAVRQGLTYVKEIDLALTELKKVTDETDATYKEFLKAASSTSAVIGSTVSDFTDATAAFARLGYSIDESAEMAKTAIVYKNVADGLDTVEESTESIISTMKAYGIEADSTMSIVDKFNAVGNNFAITSAGIGDAMQRSASALYEGGNSIDESIALITAANSVIQNPEQVGELNAQQYSNILLENSYIG